MFCGRQEISLIRSFKLVGVFRFYKHFVPYRDKRTSRTKPEPFVTQTSVTGH